MKYREALIHSMARSYTIPALALGASIAQIVARHPLKQALIGVGMAVAIGIFVIATITYVVSRGTRA